MPWPAAEGTRNVPRIYLLTGRFHSVGHIWGGTYFFPAITLSTGTIVCVFVLNSVDVVRGCKVRYAVVIENAGCNFSAYVPDLPGCIATGATEVEVEHQIREAIEFHLDGMRDDGTPIPPPSSRVEYIEVTSSNINVSNPMHQTDDPPLA